MRGSGGAIVTIVNLGPRSGGRHAFAAALFGCPDYAPAAWTTLTFERAQHASTAPCARSDAPHCCCRHLTASPTALQSAPGEGSRRGRRLDREKLLLDAARLRLHDALFGEHHLHVQRQPAARHPRLLASCGRGQVLEGRGSRLVWKAEQLATQRLPFAAKFDDAALERLHLARLARLRLPQGGLLASPLPFRVLDLLAQRTPLLLILGPRLRHLFVGAL
mmetsp:Transcript_10798/g.24873  ORF Transcript_10798/g.24873 Transcript_10798/m.24873 type:complete len:220 (+) Transcript_10798:763-1422(+)